MNEELVRKGELTQARILDAAHTLFMAQGYHGTSMRQIANRAGLTMGGVYNHFASKEDIWETVFFDRHPYHTILPMLREAEGETVDAYVRNAARRLIGELNQQQDLLRIMFIELVEFNGAHISSLFERITPELLPLTGVLQGKASALRAIPLPLLARAFLGFFFSYYMTEMMMPPAVRAVMGADALDAFIDIYLHGILKDSNVESSE